MGNRVIHEDEKGNPYFMDKYGNRHYIDDVRKVNPDKQKKSPAIIVAIIGGICTIVAAIIGAIRTGSDSKPLGCSFDIAVIQGIYACGNVTVGGQAQLSTPNIETSIAMTLTALVPSATSSPYIVIVTATPETVATFVTATPLLPTPIILTATLEPTISPITETPPARHLFCTQKLSQGEIPSSGTTYDLTVNPNEFHVWTSGPVCVNSNGLQLICLSGGRNKGNVIVLLPDNNTPTTYSMTDLNPRNNWQGIYADCSETERDNWVQDRTFNMGRLPNCPENNGCQTANVVIVRGQQIISDSTISVK